MRKRKTNNLVRGTSAFEYGLTNDEKLLAELSVIHKGKSVNHDKARSLCRWYLNHKSWTPAQRKLAKWLVMNQVGDKKKAKQKYYLYAISDGRNVKLGYSKNIKSRMKGLQVSNSVKIKLIWKYYVGNDVPKAKSAERKIHRLCKEHRLRGEWFSMECMKLVREFRV